MREQRERERESKKERDRAHLVSALSSNLDMCCGRPLPTYTRSVRMSRKLCIMGTVDGCGYDSQLKYTICEAYRPYHSILSILRPVFRQLRQIRCTFELLRSLNPKIWQFFFVDDDDNDTTDYFTPCACARGNNYSMLHGDSCSLNTQRGAQVTSSHSRFQH